MATGKMAGTFVKELLMDPSTRGVHDISHRIVAVASHTSSKRAQEFIDQHVKEKDCRAFGRFEELVKDPAVDIVYIVTPAAQHYPNVLLSLEAGKHICCEKPFTINAQQTEHLIRVARSKKLFLMEAFWTRFLPSTAPLCKMIHSSACSPDGILGQPVRLYSDLSLNTVSSFPPGKARWSRQLFNPTLGGGAILHLGVYTIWWACMVLMDHPRNEGQMPTITSSTIKTVRGPGADADDGWEGAVDHTTSVFLTFEKIGAVAVLTSSSSLMSPTNRGVLVQCEKGDIVVPYPTYRPEGFTVDIPGKEQIKHDYPIPCGQGYYYQMDACARAIRDGKLEAEECPLDKSLAVMRIMDEVRRQAGLGYSEEIESLKE